MRSKPVLFWLMITMLLLSGCSKANSQVVAVNDKTPDFSLERLDGEKVTLSEVLKDKIAVLDFWASWCPHCVKAIPQLEKFHRENKEKVAVIGVNIKESRTKVEDFARKMGVTYPIALDSDGNVAKLYNVVGIPTIVAVDRDGTVMYYGHSIEEMREKISF